MPFNVTVVVQHSPDETEENHENISQNSWYPGWDSKQLPAGVLPLPYWYISGFAVFRCRQSEYSTDLAAVKTENKLAGQWNIFSLLCLSHLALVTILVPTTVLKFALSRWEVRVETLRYIGSVSRVMKHNTGLSDAWSMLLLAYMKLSVIIWWAHPFYKCFHFLVSSGKTLKEGLIVHYCRPLSAW